jgi:hypothetical protein
MRGISLMLNHHRSGMRSWAERHHFAIGLALTLVGLAAIGAIHFLGVRGSLATMIGAFAAVALLFGQGFRWNRGQIFPPSEINRQNRWKYLVSPRFFGCSLSPLVVPGPPACKIKDSGSMQTARARFPPWCPHW